MPGITVDVLNLGRARNYDTALALNSIGRLERLYAGGYLLGKWRTFVSVLAKGFPSQTLERLSLRTCPGIPDSKCCPIWRHLLKAMLMCNRDDRFFALRQAFSQIAGIKSRAPAIIAEQTEALEAFQLAEARGAIKILMMTGQSPAGRARFLCDEHLAWPPAAPVSLGCNDSLRLVRRELEELQLADILLSPSSFVTESLRLYPELSTKLIIRVNWPLLGQDLRLTKPRKAPVGRPLHVLFVGGVGLCKGVMYLVAALEHLNPTFYEARLVGGIALPEPLLERCKSVAQVLGNLPFNQIRKQYLWADVFVLPSLSEGRARATIEAMAAGLPVIVTENTGAPVEDGVNGLIVPIRNSEAILDALQRLATDRLLYESVSAEALRTARGMTLERYTNELEAVLRRL